jgi:hypothetical protein
MITREINTPAAAPVNEPIAAELGKVLTPEQLMLAERRGLVKAVQDPSGVVRWAVVRLFHVLDTGQIVEG